MIATPQQLKERWGTSKGEIVRKQIIDHIRELNWERFLKGFPFSEEIPNSRDLRFIDLKGCKLGNANLWGTSLIGAKMNNSILHHACLSQADLSRADLTKSNIYGISVWNIITDRNTIIKDLIISEDPLFTVDDIEIAQFIWLITNNKKISNLITTMKTKSVLILGSFDAQSKLVLNKIKEILPNYDFVPIIFNFNPPIEHRLIESIKTLAQLSKFVIVDLSVKSGQNFEASIVPDTTVSFVTIAFEGAKVSEMLKSLDVYYWWRKEYFPYPKKGWENELQCIIEKKIIPWTNEINDKLLEKK